MYPAAQPESSGSGPSDVQQMLDALDQFIARLDSQDAESFEVIQLAQALAATISPTTVLPSMQRAQARVDMDVTVLWLTFKPDGKERARARGAMEVEGNFLTLKTTKELVKLALGHVSRYMEGGCRVVADVILLRVAAVLRHKHSRVFIVPDYPLDSVQVDGTRKYGGVVDYIVAKYPPIASAIIDSPDEVLKPERYRKLGSANIFAAKTLDRLEFGVPQCVLAAASWCHYGGEEVMRGGVTTGDQWIFFAYKRGDQGSCYARTEVFRVGEDLSNLDWILGVLIDWVEDATVFDPFEHFDLASKTLDTEMWA
ncbi:hypothetical protein LXA43DRAFT_896901 [Ganoderma leucocontextum]|nr:hypothetical protein LXA43DRAFT_896901 [Ganoderma leucocontextum]